VTGPFGALGAAYLALGAGGNIAAMASQLAGAATGRVTSGATAANVATTFTSALGTGAFIFTHDMGTATNWASAEQLGTVGVNGGMAGGLVDKSATFLENLFLSSESAMAASELAGVNTNGNCR
jgi:hypothetical protein